MQNINSKFHSSIMLETGEEVPFDMANWPVDENSTPILKKNVNGMK